MDAAPLSREPQRDCLPCRLTGSLTFAGVAGYLVYERARVPVVGGGAHRAVLLAGAAAFAGASIWRWRS